VYVIRFVKLLITTEADMKLDNDSMIAAVKVIENIPAGTPSQGREINLVLRDITAIMTDSPREALSLDILLQGMYLKGKDGRLPGNAEAYLEDK
jgi:hypothetical protein